ncbi:hypothetical protein [Amycolatopsis magusensis]|uniref:hypothetical protein n=1 Tax=Amycolatopsis magusensis TaxID=882444 RepID=UPI003C3074A2
MPMPNSVPGQCRALLEPDTTVEYVLPGTMILAHGVGGTPLNVLLAITETEIVVFRVKLLSRYQPAKIWARHPRRRGRATIERHGSLSATCTVGGLVIEIEDEYIAVVRAAGLDTVGGEPPLDPHPHL